MQPFTPSDIQGNVIRAYNLPHACYLLATLPGSADEAVDLVRELAPYVTTADTQSELLAEHQALVNLAFTSQGLESCGLTRGEIALWFPPDFVAGMAARSEPKLGDAGCNRAISWDWQHFHPHLLLAIHAPDHATLGGRVDDLASRLTRFAGVHVKRQYANTLDSARGRLRKEHFGFADGISQPPLDTRSPPTAGAVGGLPIDGGGWAPVPAGEFVLGLPDLDEDEPSLPCPELMRNGSYLVYRKIEQMVGAFREWATVAATSPAGQMVDPDPSTAADSIMAKLVGRKKDGTPLVCVDSPTGAPPSNNFRYHADPDGVQCPLGSHIRRANPRDALGFNGALVNRHRLIRRGMPYGARYEPGAEDSGRGLIFIAYCGSIARQFEFIQRQWLNDGDVLGIGHNTDPIAGTSTGHERFLVPGEAQSALFNIREEQITPFVRVRWGEYFFQPGRAGLEWLCTCGHDVSSRGSGCASTGGHERSQSGTAAHSPSYDPGETG